MRFVREIFTALTIILACSNSSQAATYIYLSEPVYGRGTWETTLEGRDLDGNIQNGTEGYYDTVLDITWLGYPNISGIINNNDGRLSWVEAKAFIETITIGGVGGWRLPSVNPQNGVTYNTDTSSTGLTDVGYNIISPQSELSHLYYVTLGNTGSDKWPRITDRTVDVTIINNSGPFYDLGYQTFWYNELGDADHQDGWHFGFGGGLQGIDYAKSHASDKYPQTIKNLAWYVHQGDIGTPLQVPEPRAYILTLVGLGAASLFRRKHRTG